MRPVELSCDGLAEIAGSPLDPNAFMEPWMLGPALRHIAPAGGVEIAAIRTGAGLAGYVPLKRHRAGAVASVWVYAHCYDATPLVRAGSEAEFLDLLFARLEDTGVSVLRWPLLPTDTRFAAALFDQLEARRQAHVVLHTHRRPLLDCKTRSADGFLDEVTSRKGQKKLRRRRRHLEEMGEVKLLRHDQGMDGAALAADFLRLEASGWKGAGGTASALVHRRPGDVAFFKEAVRAGALRGGLAGWSLELDGRPVAMTVNVAAGDTIWGLKTAYDERYAPQAPGVILQVEESLEAIADPVVARIDSCTDVTNSFLEGLFPERREVTDLMIAAGPEANGALRAAAAAERAWRKARGLAKTAYYALKR